MAESKGPRFTPMGARWNVPVDAARSLTASANGLTFTCGQCPLDGSGSVLDPGDLSGQARRLAGTCRATMAQAPEAPVPCLLVLYHTADPGGEMIALASPFRGAFPGAAVLPVRLPQFHDPGMRLEVDVVATPDKPSVWSFTHAGVAGHVVEAGPLTFATLSAPPGRSVAPALALIGGRGLAPARLLGAEWHGLADPPPGWAPLPGAAALPAAPQAGVSALLTFARTDVTAEAAPPGAASRRAGPFAWRAALGTAPDLATAARQAMDSLGPFDSFTALKATTLYAGGPTAEGLHASLAVRHASFPRPGPASTGVPVAGLAGGTLTLAMTGLIRP